MTDGPTTPPPATPTPPPPPAPTPGGPPGPTKSLFERAKDIVVSPKTEWGVIDAEPSTIASIYTGYVMILAAIGPIAMIVGHQLIGITILGVTYTPPIGYSIGSAVLAYIFSLALVYIVALIIDALAPSFGGAKDQTKAFKVAAYAATPGWLAGIFYLIPMLGWLSWLGALYGLFLLYLGLPRLMRAPEDKAVGYTAVVIVIEIVLYLVIAAVIGALVASFFGLGAMMGGSIRY